MCIRESLSLIKLFFARVLLVAAMVSAMQAVAAEERLPEATVTQAYIELHTGPGRGFPIFHVVERGEKVLMLIQRTDWIKVRTMPYGPMDFDRKGQAVAGSNTLEGWVHVDEMTQTLGENGQSAVAPGPSFDDLSEPYVELGMMVGVFENSDAVSGYLNYQFTRNLAIELEASEDYGNFSSGSNLSVTLSHQPFPHWRYSPYFALGGGERETSPRSTIVGTQDRTDGFLTVGGGLRVYLGGRFLLRAQYKRYTILTNRDDDEEVDEWKIGISAFF